MDMQDGPSTSFQYRGRGRWASRLLCVSSNECITGAQQQLDDNHSNAQPPCIPALAMQKDARLQIEAELLIHSMLGHARFLGR